MDTLGSTSDLFSSHEEIIGVSVSGVLRVKHGVERTSTLRVSVEHVEVSVVFLSDHGSDSSLSLSG